MNWYLTLTSKGVQRRKKVRFGVWLLAVLTGATVYLGGVFLIVSFLLHTVGMSVSMAQMLGVIAVVIAFIASIDF